MNKKLVIFDFDGVITDSEKLWIGNWQKHLNKNFDLNWDYEKCLDLLAGISLKTKLERLAKFDININEDFLTDLRNDSTQLIKNELVIIPNIENLLKLDIDKCVATGGPIDKTADKIEKLEIRKYFPNENVFCSEMVEHGKPEPDVFLHALKTMGYKKEEAIIIEDSIPGVIAANKAGIDVIAFSYTHKDKDYYNNEVNKLNAIKICDTVEDLEKTLLNQL